MRAGLENLQAESEHRSVCRFLLSVASPLIVFQGFDCFIGHWEKGDQVEDRHQTDTDVPEIPDEGVGGESSDKQHDKCQQFIGRLCAPAVTEQIGHIGPGIKQDADEGGKTEHPQDQGDEDDTDLTKIAVHSRLKTSSCGASSMTIAVQVQSSVSMKTPNACVRPTRAG